MYETGAECGRYYSVNVPLKEGIDDNSKYVECINLLLVVLFKYSTLTSQVRTFVIIADNIVDFQGTHVLR